MTLRHRGQFCSGRQKIRGTLAQPPRYAQNIGDSGDEVHMRYAMTDFNEQVARLTAVREPFTALVLGEKYSRQLIENAATFDHLMAKAAVPCRALQKQIDRMHERECEFAKLLADTTGASRFVREQSAESYLPKWQQESGADEEQPHPHQGRRPGFHPWQ